MNRKPCRKLNMRAVGLAAILGGLSGAVVMASHGPPPLGGREVTVWCIERENPALGGCRGTTLPMWTMTSKWYQEISDTRQHPHGHGSAAWVRDGRYVNDYSNTRSIRDSDFIDSSKYSWGHDRWNHRPDDVDACMIAFHGNVSSGNNRFYGRVRENEPGAGNCNTWQGGMEFGDSGGDNEFLHIYSCKSMQNSSWLLWASSFKGVHQINGFHGLAYASRYWYPGRLRDFADDSFYTSIANSWMDNLYRRRAGATNDQCPVSRCAGNGASDCWNRFNNERYNNVFSDPASPTWHCWDYLTPCSPAQGNGL